MAAASGISHLTYLAGKFCRSYMVFGVATYLVYFDYDTDKGDDDWDGIAKNKEHLKVKWVNVPGNSNTDWAILPPLNDWVRVIGKAVDGELRRMNGFTKDEVRKHLSWVKPEEWLPYIVCKLRRTRVKHCGDHNI